MKNIELPRKVIVGDGAIEKVADVVDELKLGRNALVICGHKTRKIAGNYISGKLGCEVLEAPSTEELVRNVKNKNVDFLVAAGGGTIIDITKLAAHRTNIPFLSVPTAASHDGIASPLASVKKDKPVTLKAVCPLAVIADTDIISKAPKRLFAAGCGDAISNYTSVLDWKLANKERGEYYGDYAAALSSMSALIVMENSKDIKNNVSMVVEALITSGVAIGIAGSSRPCSGSEHLFSHALDLICDKPALHGEQCGVGTIMMANLHEADWERVKKSLKHVGAPTNAEELGITEEKIIEALTIAHDMRDRYTILRNGLSQEKAQKLARTTGVIE